MNSPIIPFYSQIDKLIIKSDGCFLIDEDGKKYIDFESGDWAANLGHSNIRINKVINEQIHLCIHDGLRFRNSQSESLSVLLTEKMNMLGGQSVFLNSGSEAVNLGIYLAKKLTGRNKILKIEGTYLSAYGHGQIVPENHDLINIERDNPDSISRINFSEVAAFVFEPGNSWGLVHFSAHKFISMISSEIKKHGGLLMANEVTTGFGRTGEWFGFQHYNFMPDIVSIGKALGNGYPVSGVVVSKELAELFRNNPFRYAQSHQNDPLGCAIGVEVIKTIHDENLVEQSREKGEYFKQQLLKLKSKYPECIIEIRGRGLMIAIELDKSFDTGNICNKLLNHGFLAGCKQNVIRFMPPLIIEKKHIDALILKLNEILEKDMEI